MQVKQGVKLFGLRLPMREVLKVADKIWAAHGQELVITSTTDGVHSAGSFHPYGFAVDLRTKYFKSRQQINIIAENLKKELGPDYDVIVHNTHLHVEYDPKV